jgi:hypothetical protein
MFEFGLGIVIGAAALVGLGILWKLVIKPDLVKLTAGHAAAAKTITAAAAAETVTTTATTSAA